MTRTENQAGHRQNTRLHMIEGFSTTTRQRLTRCGLTPEIRRGMYGNHEYALIDWEKRMQHHKNQNMAKTMQRLVATSSETVQRFALGLAQEQTGVWKSLAEVQGVIRGCNA